MSFKINTKDELESFVCKHWNELNATIDKMQENLPIPFYSSVDVRESTHKFAPVDNNIYPAGFNNICSRDLNAAVSRIQSYFQENYKNCKRVAIIPESHTKNLYYLDHLHSLKSTLEKAGVQVDLISIDNALFENEQETLNLTSQSNHQLAILKAKVANQVFATANGTYDLVILNNDQSNPLPIEWDSIKTPVIPTPKIGWFIRQKVNHFCYYQKVLAEFCKKFSIDPNLMQAQFKRVENVDFASKEGLENLAKAVDTLKEEVGTDSQIFVKASQGTYGMGISVVSSGDEILNMNRKSRNKMDIGKNNIKFTTVLVQEGVETALKYDGAPAEVTVYLIDGKSIGGFLRANPLRTTMSNLNAKGMVYQKYCLSEIKENCEHQIKEAIYSIVARLSTIASSYEIKDVI
ncbi:MAG: glutamate--cysteine ligase [Bacteriovoracaceae bacterium]|nr:glutamate--cysteine ligase [Bacteriovoracaceae bacterium]